MKTPPWIKPSVALVTLVVLTGCARRSAFQELACSPEILRGSVEYELGSDGEDLRIKAGKDHLETVYEGNTVRFSFPEYDVLRRVGGQRADSAIGIWKAGPTAHPDDPGVQTSLLLDIEFDRARAVVACWSEDERREATATAPIQLTDDQIVFLEDSSGVDRQ